MNMELGVDSKPKEHPTPEFADNWRFRPLVAASWIAVDDKLWQKHNCRACRKGATKSGS
jgi:hypothetical protein